MTVSNSVYSAHKGGPSYSPSLISRLSWNRIGDRLKKVVFRPPFLNCITLVFAENITNMYYYRINLFFCNIIFSMTIRLTCHNA